MPTNSLLINYNDCPSSLDSFIPDNGLANLAGCLIARGNRTEILDYSTIQTLMDFRPKHISRKLRRAFTRYKLETFIFGKMLRGSYEEFRKIDDDIRLCRDNKIGAVVKDISARIDAKRPDFIAFKLWSGEGFLGSARIAGEIKKRYPQLKIFGGGPHAEVYGEKIFRYTKDFDILCAGEGEEIIVKLSDYAEGKIPLADIPSIIYKNNGKIVSNPVKFIDDLNRISDPVYDEDVYPAMKGDNKLKIIMVEESRGCPYACNFCIHRIKSGNKWRVRRVPDVIDTIKKLSGRINTTAFKFSGSNTPHFFRKELARRLIDDKIDIKYVGFADTRQPGEEDYALLKRSGCVSLFFGVESADPYLLEHMMNKNTDPERIRESLKRARGEGIMTAASIIAPCPGEKEDSVKKTIEMLIDAKPHGVSVYPPVCYPRTKWFLESGKFNFELMPDAEDKMMTYTIKFTMPPPLLAPVPYKVNGKDFYEMMDEVVAASRLLEKGGITTGLNDSLLFMAYMLKIKPRMIKKLNQQGIILGEINRVKQIIADFNSAARVR